MNTGSASSGGRDIPMGALTLTLRVETAQAETPSEIAFRDRLFAMTRPMSKCQVEQHLKRQRENQEGS